MSLALSQLERFNPYNPILKNAAEKKADINPKQYVCSMSSCQIANRIAYIMASTGIGAAIGAGVGSTAIGIGAGPGAGIGAAVGFGVGVAVTSTWEICSYKKWEKTQKQEVITSLHTKLSDATDDRSLLCGLTLEPVRDPVVTPYSNVVYEKEYLIKWINKAHTDPITNQLLTVKQLSPSLTALGGINGLCKNIIDQQIKVQHFTDLEMEGIIAIKEDCEQNITNVFKVEREQYAQRVQKKEMNLHEFAEQMKRFADAVDPKQK